MPAQVFREGVHDHVCPMIQGLLQIGRGEGIVYHGEHILVRGDTGTYTEYIPELGVVAAPSWMPALPALTNPMFMARQGRNELNNSCPS